MQAGWRVIMGLLMIAFISGCDVDSITQSTEESEEETRSDVTYSSGYCQEGTTQERTQCLLGRYHATAGAYGSLIYIVDSQGMEYNASAGVKSTSSSLAPSITDEFRIGQISELFVSLGLLYHAYHDAEFSVSDYASEHLPDGLNDDQNLTGIQTTPLLALMQHRGGYGDFLDAHLSAFISVPESTWSLSGLKGSSYTTDRNFDYISQGESIIIDENVLYAPYNDFLQTTFGYHILGEALQEINATDDMATMMNTLVDTVASSMYSDVALRMENTYYPESKVFLGEHLSGYIFHDNSIKEITEQHPSFYGADAALISTATDIMNLSRYVNSAQFQSTAFYSSELMNFRQTDTSDLAYSIGLKKYENRYIGMDGMIPGYVSFMFYDPQTAINVVIVSNYTDGVTFGLDGVELVKEIVELFE